MTAPLPKRPAELHRSENGLLIDGEGMSYAPHMEPFAPGNQAKLLAAHEHAVAVRAVEALRDAYDKQKTIDHAHEDDCPLCTMAKALTDIDASGWRA